MEGKWFISCGLPGELIDKWKQVSKPKHLQMQVEALSAVMVLCTFPQVLRSRSAVWFEDCRAVQSALMNGFSRGPCTSMLASGFGVESFHLDVVVWLDRVSSTANPSDGTSRFLLESVGKLGCTKVDPRFPEWLSGGASSMFELTRKSLT